jgi:phosphoesterase RecJ-like protein
MISLDDAAAILQSSEKTLILCHRYPDGDTLGSAAALCLGLRKTGKRARIKCSDKIGAKYDYIFKNIRDDDFTPDLTVTVDIADKELLGEPLLSAYGDKVGLCIDHHPSNTKYAPKYFVDPKAAATCEIIFRLLKLMGIEIDKPIASALYTGITTDTGCFKYINVTPDTYRIAADLVETGIDSPSINRIMFDTKSRARVEMEKRVMDSIEYARGGSIAVIEITKKMIAESGAVEDDLDGLATIPRGIEGVRIGITLREKDDGTYKISLRAHPPADASDICAVFGGGGHKGAAGCTIAAPLKDAKAKIINAAKEYLDKNI